MDNQGALLCDSAPTLFQDSGKREMDENFISSDMTKKWIWKELRMAVEGN